MASETDCSSPSRSSELKRKRKLQKKLEKKSKKHKKEKKKKNKKRNISRKETTSSSEENLQTNSPFTQCRSEFIVPNVNDENKFGPALPPHLQTKTEDRLVIGPVVQKKFIESTKLFDLETDRKCKDNDDDMQDSYGPLPVANECEMSTAQIQLEQRALELKMAAIAGISATVSEQNVREEWMLKLPDVGLKGGLASLTNMKRGFHQGKEKPDFGDRSSWTKKPQTENEIQNITPTKICKEHLELQALALYEKQRDAEQEAIAKKHKKKHKREQSLVEMHQKKLRKEKKKANKLIDSGAKPNRRPFKRDVDLKLNKIDRNQTKQIVDKAKILNTKFSAGHSKYL